MNNKASLYRKSLPMQAAIGLLLSQFITGDALATVTPVTKMGTCGSGTIGGVVACVIQGSNDSHALLPALCYLFGIVIGVFAILKTIEHVQNPNQVSVWEPIKRAITAGALFACPYVTEAVWRTLVAGDGGDGIDVFGWAGAPTGGGLDAMVVALLNDAFVPMAHLLMLFCYLAGFILTMVGISRLMKSAQEGPRGPGGFGTIMTFLMAGALFSADELMAAFSRTFFGTDLIAVTAVLSFTGGLTGPEEQHVLAVISAVLAFVMVLGWISFIRGWFIIRDVAEGSQQASMMSGMTHILGGALAINLGPVLNAVQQTFGLGAVGVNFF